MASGSLSHLERGREAYSVRAWREARDALRDADAETPLEPDDLRRLAIASFLVGEDDAYVDALERAHGLNVAAGNAVAAARDAFWIGFHLGGRGDVARATGWLGRAGRLLEEVPGDHVEHGYLVLPSAHRKLMAGDAAGAAGLAGEAVSVAQRFDDGDLLALALHLQGRARIAEARVPEGLALLDEAMVAVASGELSPPVTGLIYCSVISACRSVYALGRSHEWTAALRDWCDAQPSMAAFTGECRVYRSELMQLHGSWDEALDEARRAGEQPHDTGGAATSMAFYQQGEIHRLRGEHEAAEAAYRDASRAGRQPQPGLALLRLAQGDADAAAAALRTVLAEIEAPLQRARLLPAQVEVALAAGDLDRAASATRELKRIADTYGTEALAALAGHCEGALLLAEGEPAAALPLLRRAWQAWHDLDASYDAARVRVLLAAACRELGDEDTADLEIEAARATFLTLSAASDLERLDAPGARGRRGRADHGLTPREVEVLELVATGRTNRAIAEDLFISEKTVARHISNIFTKLGVSSRAAATAFAYEHDLARPTS